MAYIVMCPWFRSDRKAPFFRSLYDPPVNFTQHLTLPGIYGKWRDKQVCISHVPDQKGTADSVGRGKAVDVGSVGGKAKDGDADGGQT